MALNLDNFMDTIETHSIILNGKEYKAKPLTLKELMEIQDIYANFDEDGDDTYGPLKILLEKVGYPAEEIMELPVQAVMQVQKELFLSLTETAEEIKKLET